ncbi:hypothetical protein [Pseudomonas aeruginosa]|uniref:hypothetical protein n=1 Tax=Pseudomonas aeruginosa TaxID=287 RepID=UPI001C8C6980|nr:hypothetical protein [Pseudomonas aeruginosa]MDP1372830.1 hypothetical protein [Pseudomonas aeruginosa]
MTESKICTCPSGDGSLRWPCPAHPAVEQADVAAKLTFINGRPAMCGCQVEYSDGGGEYSDVIYVTLCAKHSGSAILDLVATNRIALTPEYEGQWHADLYLDREIPLAKVEGATPAEAVLALMSAERIDPEQESVGQAGGDRWDALKSIMEWTASENIPDERKLCLIRNAARAALAQPSPVRSSLLINGYQLRAALDFIAPDGTAEQLKSEACIEWRQQDADFLEAGLYAFCAEYPEEGGVLLDEEPTTAQPSPLQSEQAEAERPALWAVHAQGPDELYAAFSREDAEKHAAELNALPMPEGIAVGAVVVPSPWPAVQHWQYLAEQEQDHKNEIAGRLRQLERICEGLPQDAIDGGWTVQGIRGYAKRLEDQLKAALARVAELETALEPFAAVADAYDDSEDDDHEPYTDMGCDDRLRLTLGQHRAGRIALEGRTPQAQAQHSVPDHAELLQALERTHAGHMVGHDQSDQPNGGYSDGYVNGFGECIKVARKVLAAAPGKEGV